MFTSKSKTGIGLTGVAVFIIVYLLKYIGLEVVEADIVTLVSNIVGAGGIIMSYYGQWSRKDMSGFMTRVDSE